ncbi:MAG: L-tyrosine/L-tryptophan isonitrile synthase family protein [Patescibacteria group bacterium]
MQSNPYVYPYVPFADLSRKDFRPVIVGERRIDDEALRSLVRRLPAPQPAVIGTTPAERILSIFSDESVRFGPREFIDDNRDAWLQKIDRFVATAEKIPFTILGFPFKIAVPLKTNRTMPDLGEATALRRLADIIDCVRREYAPGAHITVFTEGAFGRFSGIPESVWMRYREALKRLVAILDYNDIEIRDLGDMENTVPDFAKRWEAKTAELGRLYENGDHNIREKYEGTRESLYRIIPTKERNLEVLMDVYNEDLTDDAVSNEVRAIRKRLREEVHKAIFKYHAYLGVRDDLHYLETVAPGAIPLSVSPKPNRLGIIPLNLASVRLPYHGVPVYYPEKNLVDIEYLVDLLRSAATYTAVHWENDGDPKPFYYETYA